MAEKTYFYVEGYRFDSLEDAEQAQIEQKKVSYFKSKFEDKGADHILAAYDNILDEKVFVTPVGWEYLKQIQDELIDIGVPTEQIRPIPMFNSFVHSGSKESAVRQRVIPAKKKNGGQEKFIISVIANIVLLVLVVAMFVITLNSKNPNILNYEKEIINKYASWDQELTERENRVREKEAELFTD